MKKILTILTIAFICSCSYAQTPPKAVKDAFAKKFPNSTKISWGKEAPKEWESEFTFEGNKISANFAENGTWLETEKKIKTVDLPKAVLVAINKKYPGCKILEADKTETSKHGTIYEADIKYGSKKTGLAFKENGTPVNE